MAGINPYSLNPPRTNGGNANPFGTESVMPQSNMPVSGTTTSSFSTRQNVQQDPMTTPGNQLMGVAPEGPQNQLGLLASQMRSRSSAAAPAVQNAMNTQPMQLQPQKGIQPGQASANASPKMTVY